MDSESSELIADNLTVDWSNADNAHFYEDISVESNIENSVLGGLEEGFDVDIFYSQIANAKTILEVGAGYGRVIKALIDRNYQGQIYGIERSKKLCRLLNEKFKDKAYIIERDLKSFEPSIKFEVILWLFSGISDFSKDEHLSILEKLLSMLSNNGMLIMDTFPNTKPANAFAKIQQTYLIELEGKMLKGYLVSSQEMQNYAQHLGMTIKTIPYLTPTNSKRCINILRKK